MVGQVPFGFPAHHPQGITRGHDHLTTVLGSEVSTVRDPVERHALNILHREGDTHGAHTDDHPPRPGPLLESPPHPDDGGLLEFHPGHPGLDDLDSAASRRAHHRPGEG
ncbi:hypothetical protein [Streptomyces antarcticus]|uniref:hypothetical protein n=1 Tax=Streptomyces antarcticus TaxID=2996458 RepID=UPI00226D4942|nr:MULTISPECIES: hypothetical protein [unclassified Streptomyces]MCY0947640.1 hypothetical protein [Streptomyces sp. H34-AA3]MCZ4087710.1 hypothetical protein [Streptomyces sp. H34-S5]